MLASVARPDSDVGDRPAGETAAQDRAERDEREEVALVDAGRDDEEGDGEDRQPDEDRPAVRPAGHDKLTAMKTASVRAVPTTTAGIGPNENAWAQRAKESPLVTTMSQTQARFSAMPLPPKVTSAHGFQALTDRYG